MISGTDRVGINVAVGAYQRALPSERLQWPTPAREVTRANGIVVNSEQATRRCGAAARPKIGICFNCSEKNSSYLRICGRLRELLPELI